MVVATISTASFAQIGAQVGLTAATLSSDDFDDVDKGTKIGFTLGLFHQVPTIFYSYSTL